MMQIFVSPDGPSRWAWTEGFADDELAVPLTWEEGDDRDRQISELIRSVRDYCTAEQCTLADGDTMTYGWTLLRFRPSTEDDLLGSGFLIVQELTQPLADQGQEFIDGAEQSIMLLDLQEDAIRRNVVEGQSESPYRDDQMVICTRVPPAGFTWRYPLVLARLEHKRPTDSGWFLGCHDQEHDHDDAHERERARAIEVTRALPGIFPYLAMPVGTTIILDETQAVIFRVDDDEGYVDPGPLFVGFER